ncbi:MAG: ammonia-forming cytochrome c nitrite reductase subunit c552 [Campylobacterales bacterium]
MSGKRLVLFSVLFLAAIAVSVGVFALFADIGEKKSEGRQYPLMLAELSDANPDFEVWGRNFPSHLDAYKRMEKATDTPTDFGGNLPYSKLIRYPQLTTLWAGYAFAVDFNEERSHYYTQIDQMETMRNNKAYLNAHGLGAFKGQPGACMNCHSGWAPELIRQMGWEDFNGKPYWETIKQIEAKHGGDVHGAKLGSTCADCHSPQDMSLRITRPAYVNAMVARGYEADERQGLKATRAEMRSHVCQQCHVEYYFQGKNSLLTFPWTEWEKDEPFRIEMMDAYYDAVKAGGVFEKDWVHRDTKAPMIKVQHPEAELYSSGVHARSGVSCADCHMPYKREGANKITEHFIASPLNNINASCKTCHAQSEKELGDRVSFIQQTTANGLRQSETALLSLIADLKTARAELAKHPKFAALADPKAQEAEISKALQTPLELHRKASMRWDFVASENSTGFHSPQEASRILGQSMEMARRGQIETANALAAYGITLKLTPAAKAPGAPKPIELHHAPVGSAPPAKLIAVDRATDPLEY